MRVIRKIYQFFVDRPIEKGTILNNRYKVLHMIGAGSYGLVYLCEDVSTAEKKVVKQLRPSKQRKKEDVELFHHEIAVLRKLNHKNIPTFYDAFSQSGHLFYAMSYIEGDNLEDLIFYKKNTFNEKESLLILTHLLDLVDYLHQNTIYHQDLRIPNMLLKNKEFFLIDFGLSKHGAAGDAVSHPHTPAQKEIQAMKLEDYYDLGEILLFMLYTTYSGKNKKALPWTEELSLEKETVHLLKRLLQIERPYANTREISKDLQAALLAQKDG